MIQVKFEALSVILFVVSMDRSLKVKLGHTEEWLQQQDLKTYPGQDRQDWLLDPSTQGEGPFTSYPGCPSS